MNDFMAVFNEYGWGVFYFAGFVTGSLISLFIAMVCNVADALAEFIKDKKERNRKK